MPKEREISAGLRIGTYMTCSRCLAEKPANVTPRDWARFNVGFTKLGIQVWCVRHGLNVVHIDFQGQRHPAATFAEVPGEPVEVESEDGETILGTYTTLREGYDVKHGSGRSWKVETAAEAVLSLRAYEG